MKAAVLILSFIYFSIEVFSQKSSIDTTFRTNQQKFIVRTITLNKDCVILTIFCNSRKILSDTLQGGGLYNIELIDFNKDKSADIKLTYGGGNFSYFLYLFDNKTNSYKTVKDFVNYPEARQLKSNTKYYYSYYSTGCGDLNWISDLFVIHNFRAIQKGHIEGKGCDFKIELYPQEINIYKIFKNKEENRKLISKLPLVKYVPKYDDKWAFIKKYWNKNYLKFQ